MKSLPQKTLKNKIKLLLLIRKYNFQQSRPFYNSNIFYAPPPPPSPLWVTQEYRSLEFSQITFLKLIQTAIYCIFSIQN